MQYYGTLGPACADVDILAKMFLAGMTGIRLNLAHGDLETNGHWLDLLKHAAERCGITPEILIDLRGPELRLGKMDSDIFLEENSVVWMTDESNMYDDGMSEQHRINDHAPLASSTSVVPVLTVPSVFLRYAESGDHILIDDGKLELELMAAKMPLKEGHVYGHENLDSGIQEPVYGVRGGLLTRVIRGGWVKQEKSLAIVGKELPLPTLTKSDYRNIGHALQFGVTGVMLPFVRNQADLKNLRNALEEAGAGKIQIFAKIENMQGVRSLRELFPYADHIVIARGDLGNAMPLWELPRAQKQISEICRAAGKPFMVVTQMLDSMHERAVPTRAEVSDIYNAALDGASSLMLTGETAAGKYPVEAMEYLVKTGEEAKKAMNVER